MARLGLRFSAAWGRLFGRARARLARPKRRWIVTGTGAVMLAVGVAIFALTGGESAGPSELASAASTTTVERRDLSESLSESGDLGFAGSETVIARQSGTVTWLPSRGTVVRRGDRLLEVDELPVTLMFGSVPAYRDLEYGVEDGVDVKQLERNLGALGYDPYGAITLDDEFTSATTDAVIRWQEDLGVEETGVVALGDVAFMDGPRRVSSLEVSLGSGIGSSGGGGAAVSTDEQGIETSFAAYADMGTDTGGVTPGGEGDGEVPGGQGDGAAPDGEGGGETPDSQGGGAKPGDQDEQGGKEPQAAPADQMAAPSAGASIAPSGGSTPAADSSTGGTDGDAPSTEVLETTSARRAVTVQLDAADQDFARKGARAVVDMPDGSEAKGRITSVSTEAAEAEGAEQEEDSDPELVVEVVIRLEKSSEKATAIEEAPVTVELERVIRKNVLTVPVTAVGAGTGGGYTVTVVAADGETDAVPVETGVFSDGYVEIEGEGIREGMKVEVPE